MRILDAVEHDEQRRRGCGRLDELAKRVVARRLELRDDPLVDAAARQRDRASARRRARSATLCCARERERLVDAPIAARPDAQPRTRPRAQRLEHGLMP